MANEAVEVSDELVDQVAEWLGMKLRKSHIKAKLREIYPDVKICTIMRLITLAKARIIEIFNVDPNEFKGLSIEFYSAIIRNPDSPIKYKLVAQQRLDILLGLENVVTEDPQQFAQKIHDAMKEMDSSLADK
jgi:hypothetical protein